MNETVRHSIAITELRERVNRIERELWPLQEPAPTGSHASAGAEKCDGAADLSIALALVLPMAKGYAADHPVGNNQAMVESAERVLLAHPEQQSTAREASIASKERHRTRQLADAITRQAETEARLKEAEAKLADEEREHLSTIRELDYREEVINKMMGAVGLAHGHDYDWSSHFNFDDALVMMENQIEADKEQAVAREREIVFEMWTSLEAIQTEPEYQHAYDKLHQRLTQPANRSAEEGAK